MNINLSDKALAIVSEPAPLSQTVRLLSHRFAAAVAHALSSLRDSQLDVLPNEGVIAVNLADLSAGTLCFDSVEVLCVHLDSVRIDQLQASPTVVVSRLFFQALHEWVVIDHHLRGVFKPEVDWATLDRQERVLCTYALMHEINALGLLLESIDLTTADRRANRERSSFRRFPRSLRHRRKP